MRGANTCSDQTAHCLECCASLHRLSESLQTDPIWGYLARKPSELPILENTTGIKILEFPGAQTRAAAYKHHEDSPPSVADIWPPLRVCQRCWQSPWYSSCQVQMYTKNSSCFRRQLPFLWQCGWSL
ncbi:beta-defensin 50 isoform X1 [Rattus norvegicus]|uniref:beta-defensin 50 isoform X1 n=1 Tax=Rattus norvegicus TaxID=10116 RepID=UPI002FD85AFB